MCYRLVIPVYRGNSYLQHCVQTLLVSCNVRPKILLVNNIGDSLFYDPWFNDYESVAVVTPEQALSMPKLINLYTSREEPTFFVNERVRVTQVAIDSVLETVKNNKDSGFFIFEPNQVREDLDFFGLTYGYLEKLGFMDEFLFSPLYYEADWMRRADLLKLDHIRLEAYYHLAPWTPVHTFIEKPTIEQEVDYYTRKWGGLPGHEIFTSPFNKGF